MKRSFFFLFALLFLAAGTLLPAEKNQREELKLRFNPPPRPRVEVAHAPPYYQPLDVSVWTNSRTYVEGSEVNIFVRSSQDAWLYVFSTDGYGATRQLFPNAYDRDNFVRRNRTVRLPSHRYRLVASSPGWDTIHVIAVGAERTWDPPRILHRYNSRQPFPLFKGGIESARESLKQEIPKPRKETGEAPKDYPAPDFQDGDKLHQDRREKLTVRPRPPYRYRPGHHAPSYGEDYVQIHVRPAFYRPPRYFEDHFRERPYYHPHPRRDFDEAEDPGKLRLTSSPSRAEVYINGHYYGRTPFETKLPEGRYEVVIQKPGYQSYRDEIGIHEDRRSSISTRLQRPRR